MRPYVLAFAVLAASANPAPAQVDPLRGLRDAEVFSQQQSDRQRSIELENRLNALDARLQTERSLRNLEVQQSRHAPARSIPPDDARPSSRSPGYASIPDDRLAASNARVRDASRNRR
jgi:hypothetical protein